MRLWHTALKPEETKSVEDYAGKKWTRSINRSAVSGGSCIGYTITETGCDLSASPCSINVAGLVASVSPTSTTASIACNQANYAGSVNYTCINGTANLTTSCTAATPCSVTPTGVSAAITAASGSTGSGTCDVAHYTGTASFTCSSGTPTYISQCTCATGYTGSGCSTCDFVNNYVSGGGGTCVLACTVPSGSGTTLTTVLPGTVSTNCNASGYYGTLSYTCSGGSPISVTTPCLQACTGGDSVDTTTVPGSVIHKFLNSGTLNCTSAGAKTSVQVLVVGGGGGGGYYGGGGGGGGVVYKTGHSLSAASYAVTVGAGGVASNTAGSDSVFDTMTAYGGGRGGTQYGLAFTSGGSGGGTARTQSGAGGTATRGIAGGGTAYGNNAGTAPSGSCGGSGGGGAGGAGGAGICSPETGGAGGSGISIPITGSGVLYGGGGAGAPSSAAGGSGGGGATGVAGTNGLGGGGGFSNQKNGGSGVVIIRY